MDDEVAVRCIAERIEAWYRTFALAQGMEHGGTDVEWVKPAPGGVGPAAVFRVALDPAHASERLDALTPQVAAGKPFGRPLPATWILTPASTPANVRELLLARGFEDVTKASSPEPGMALDLAAAPALPEPDSWVKVRRVRPPGAFATWVDVMNDALHDPAIAAPAYRAWLDHPAYAFYLAYLGHLPVATAATLREGDVASIEFVGTRAAYRRRGAATAACVQALRDLQAAGVRTVTVQSSAEAVSLYERLGFRTYFTLTALVYPR